MTAPTQHSAISRFPDEDAEDLYQHAPCGYLSTLPDGTIIKANATFLEWTGYAADQFVDKKRFQELLPVAGRIFYDTHFGPLLLMQGFAKELAFELICADGSRLPILLNSVLKRDASGNPLVIRTILLDARGRRAYEEELRLAKRKAETAEDALRKLTDELETKVAQRTFERDRIWKLSRDILAVASLEGYFVSFNPAFTDALGWTQEDLKTTSFAELAHPDHLAVLRDAVNTLSTGEPVRMELLSRHKDGTYRCLSWTVVPEGAVLYASGRDITEEKKRAETLLKTEEALRQAQKLESIGKLTGGVAHDFNNILQVIGGNLELLRLDFAGDHHAASRLKITMSAVDRGANLASQLLSFARRQPLQPIPANLGRIVRETDDLLRRILGESIEIETIVSGGLWNTLVDRHQFENVLLNLAINARDAMNGTGRLTLELGNALLDDHYAQTHDEVVPGQYVMLAVSDTGTGMTREVIDRAFEPFFTTKREGEGTGLGLSMAYGFVKQSGGHIKIYSEVGHGTTFKIYLPRVHEAEAIVPDVRKKPMTGGTETILVVEDDLTVQATTVEILSGLGYRVLKANNAQSALTILESGISVDLLFTDVVMPGPLRSPDLAKRAKALLPDIEVLYTSGYTQNAIVHGGRLDPGVELLSKPYRREELARKIRSVFVKKEQEPAPQTIKKSPATMVDAEKKDSSGSFRILVVEDNEDSQLMLCELLGFLGHEAKGASSAEQALERLKMEEFDALITDVSLPGMSGMELARKVVNAHPALKIVFASGYGAINTDEFSSVSLPKPYDLVQLQKTLAQLV
jgi:PAS domain S-box-containing protein